MNMYDAQLAEHGSRTFNDKYIEILRDLWFNGVDCFPRGMRCKELLSYSFHLNNPADNVISLKGFETNLDYAKEELAWYESGDNDINFSKRIKNVWQKYAYDDVHALSGYGRRIFGNCEVLQMSQWEWVKRELIRDADSRRAIINLNDKNDKSEMYTKDMPCTVFMQFLVRNGKLNMIASMRSNDIVLGVRNDVYCFTSLQQRMAKELNVSLGAYFHHAGSMHLYEKNWNDVNVLFE